MRKKSKRLEKMKVTITLDEEMIEELEEIRERTGWSISSMTDFCLSQGIPLNGLKIRLFAPVVFYLPEDLLEKIRRLGKIAKLEENEMIQKCLKAGVNQLEKELL